MNRKYTDMRDLFDKVINKKMTAKDAAIHIRYDRFLYFEFRYGPLFLVHEKYSEAINLIDEELSKLEDEGV